MPGDAPALRQLVLKMHSRCDLACDYCYVYQHADQRWRTRPRVVDPEVGTQLARRLAAHTARHRQPSVRIVLHGGEPLLAGPAVMDEVLTMLRAAVPATTRLDYVVQTNGVLLDARFLDVFHRHGVRVGVSLDGDRAANDRHRLRPDGRSSHAAVQRALSLLNQPEHRGLYAGILCTIDVRNDPVGTYEALLRHRPPEIDLLLPHGNWTTPPPYRAADATSTPYADWLIAIFDRWYRAPRRETGVRLFESVLSLLLGGPSWTRALGAEPGGVLTVETDGSVEGSDTLRSASMSVVATGKTVFSHSLDELLSDPVVTGPPGVSSALCQRCELATVCGGGLPAHRYRAGSGLANPSVYCPDLYRMISHIAAALSADLTSAVAATR